MVASSSGAKPPFLPLPLKSERAPRATPIPWILTLARSRPAHDGALTGKPRARATIQCVNVSESVREKRPRTRKEEEFRSRRYKRDFYLMAQLESKRDVFSLKFADGLCFTRNSRSPSEIKGKVSAMRANAELGERCKQATCN